MMFTVELRTQGRAAQKKKARFIWLPSKTGYNFACVLVDTRGFEIERPGQIWNSEVWI